MNPTESTPPTSPRQPKPIERILRIVMPIVAVISMIIFVPWNIVGVWATPLPSTVQAQLDQAVNHDIESIIVYVDQAGQPPALYAAGVTDRVSQAPVDPRSLFKIASISKLYVAAAAAKMVDQHMIELDDTLADLLPDLADRIQYADRITLRMMLQHRSGIPNFVDQPGFEWTFAPQDYSDYLDLVLDRPADFEPDTNYTYSNTNYLLVAMIMDDVLGYSHSQYIQDEILHPLGLTHTYATLSDVDLDEMISGYDLSVEDDLRSLDHTAPSGSMVASAEEVGIFLRALIDGTLLTPWQQQVYSSVYSYEHTGWLPGYQSIARYHPDIDAVVIQFVGTTGDNTEGVAPITYNRIIRILSKP